MDVGDSAVTGKIIGAYHATYDFLGFGMPESVCANALAVELQARGVVIRREVPFEIVYRGVPLGSFRVDMLVEEQVVVEIKASPALSDADERQLLNYLRASNCEVGLLLHYGPTRGFKRLVYSKSRR